MENVMHHEIMSSVLDKVSKRLKSTAEQGQSARGLEKLPEGVLGITWLHAGEI